MNCIYDLLQIPDKEALSSVSSCALELDTDRPMIRIWNSVMIVPIYIAIAALWHRVLQIFVIERNFTKSLKLKPYVLTHKNNDF